jgi:hypothetical protein
MPQVWLSDEELGELLESDPVLARHHALQNDWPRRTCVDGVLRYVLPPGPALKYVLWNARSRPVPRDAVLFDQALEQVRDLQRELAEARATVNALQQAVETLTAGRTDEMVSALQGLAAKMRDGTGREKTADRSAA